MRKLVVTENTTVDGVVSPIGDWFDPTAGDPELRAVTDGHGAAADALVLGRVTYEEFASFWPHQTDDPTGVARYLDGVNKYVVSSTLKTADWVNTTILRGPVEQELAALKRAEGRDIVVTGSVRLAQSLVRTQLVDVYRLFVYPVVQGHGRRLFDTAVPGLTLAQSRSFPSGVVLLEYQRR